MNEFWNNIGCPISAPTFSVGVSMIWEKEEDTTMIGNKSTSLSITIKVYFYEVFLSEIIYCPLFYFIAILISFFCPARFVVSHSLGGNNSESIGQKYLSCKSTRKQMNCGGKSC